MINLPFWGWMLIGAASGIIIFPMILGLFLMIRNTMERRKVKRMIALGQFLTPLDKRDYNFKAWEKIIDVNANEESMKNLNKRIFKTDVPRNGKGITGDEH